MVKTQGILAGCVFSLLLAAHGAMVLLTWFPTSILLWQANLVFAREARPFLEFVDWLARGSSLGVIAILLALVGLAFVTTRAKRPLWPAAASHIAFGTIVYLGVASSSRLSARVDTASLGDIAAGASHLSASQYGLLGLAAMLFVACCWAHVRMVGGAMHDKRHALH